MELEYIGAIPYHTFRLKEKHMITDKEYTPWKDLTDIEKGELLLAHHEGRVIEFYNINGWNPARNPTWDNNLAYRIKPEPVVETVTVYSGWPAGGGWSQDRDDDDTHKITFQLIDGKPDCNSIKMEEI